MGVLADHQILQRIRLKSHPDDYPCGWERGITVSPFEEKSPPGSISYGISSYGLDLRVGYKFKVFTPVNCGVIDPKNFDSKSLVDVDLDPSNTKRHLVTENNVDESNRYKVCCVCGKSWWLNFSDDKIYEDHCGLPPLDHVLIPPNSFALAETVEVVELPRDVLGILLDKSTYRRCGIIVSATVIEPQWRGKITIEISNTAPLPARIYCNQGIAQLIFLKADQECRTSYQDRKGRYQDQQGIVLPFVQ